MQNVQTCFIFSTYPPFKLNAFLQPALGNENNYALKSVAITMVCQGLVTMCLKTDNTIVMQA